MSSLFYSISPKKKQSLFLYRDQHYREADDLIATLDPKNTNQVTFDAYIRDNFGDLDLKQLEKMDKSDSRSRETRRVRFPWRYLCMSIFCFADIFSR